MQPLYSLDHLQEYAQRIERQKEVLQLSNIFSTQEKTEILDIYDRLAAITNGRIAKIKDVEDAINS